MGLGREKGKDRALSINANLSMHGAEEETETRSHQEAAEPRGKETDSPGSESQLATY